MRISRLILVSALVGLLGAGCADAPPPAPPAPTPSASSGQAFDVSKVSCDQIEQARTQVAQEYDAAVKAASDAFVEATKLFEADLNSCLSGIWKGGPCDAEYRPIQAAYEKAMGDISNDDAYHAYKDARAAWDKCYADYANKQKDWIDTNKKKESDCKDEFDAKRNQASQAYSNAVAAARAKREADYAALNELEKKCKEKKTETSGGGGVTTGGGVTGGTTDGTTDPGGTDDPGTPPPTVGANACQPPTTQERGIPGSNGTPRTGRANDFGPKDIVVNLITQVAEDVTGSPIPTSAIDDQIFAGIVCVKIRSRIAEMTIDESDAQMGGNRREEIRLRKKLAQYNSALNVWCKIAEGRPPVAEVKKDVAAINQMPSGFCKTDAECGSPLCCSANTIAVGVCMPNGSCGSKVQPCGGALICMGPDYSQPLFDHCGPAHDGNWGFGSAKPTADWPFPQAGKPRAVMMPKMPAGAMELHTETHVEMHMSH